RLQSTAEAASDETTGSLIRTESNNLLHEWNSCRWLLRKLESGHQPTRCLLGLIGIGSVNPRQDRAWAHAFAWLDEPVHTHIVIDYGLLIYWPTAQITNDLAN